MANNCYFEMKVAGPEEKVKELIKMLQWKEEFENTGLGRVYSFEPNFSDYYVDPKGSGMIQVTGYGDCAWSVLTAMMNYKDRSPSLESETKRLGVAVEIYSSEPGCCFQEHYVIDKGTVLTNECVDYEDKSEEELQEMAEELETTVEHIKANVNDNGDYCVGGFGEQFGVFSDLLSELEYTSKTSKHIIESLAVYVIPIIPTAF